MFENRIFQPLFPTYVWVHDLEPEIAARLNRQLAQDLQALTEPLPRIEPGENWQTEQVLHELEQFSEAVEIFKAASKGVSDALEVVYESFAITGCWANMNPAGARHKPHTHPNNFLSGVYYVAAPEGGDSISFLDPRPQQNVIAPPFKRPNQLNALSSDLKVKPGRLVIFPAWLTHSVLTNRSDQLRISIGFNIMFTACAEAMSRPKWGGLPIRR